MDIQTASKLLKNTKREDLVKIISKLSEYSNEANECLLSYCRKNCEKEKNIVIQEQIQHYWDVAERIIDEANEYGGTSYKKEDEAYDALNEIYELAKKNETPWQFRQRIVDDMMEQFCIGNSGFEDALIDDCMELCRTKEEKLYLADALTKAGNGYYTKVAANLYLKYGEDDTFVKLQSENLRFGSDYIKLAEYYKKQKQPEKAISLVEEALLKADGRMDEIYRWLFNEYKKRKQEDKIQWLYKKALSKKRDEDVMVELMYGHSQDYASQKEYLLKMVETCDKGEIRKWFDECKEKLRKEDFQSKSAYLHSVLKKRNVCAYLQLRIDEGETQEVLKYLEENPVSWNGFGVNADHSFSKQIANAYPKEICDQYWKECEMLCRQSNKNNYMSAVHILTEIKSISRKNKLMDLWEKEYTAFLERHKKKTLLMGYIEREKKL